MHQVILEAITLLQPSLKNLSHQILLDIPENIEVTSYPGPLGQIITNLIQNALMHAFDNQPQGLITLQASYDQQKQLVKLSLKDNGCGMDKEIQNKAFDPFFTTKIGQGGTGLGLHLVHNLVTGVLGGRLELTSQLGEGSLFMLTFPSQQVC